MLKFSVDRQLSSLYRTFDKASDWTIRSLFNFRSIGFGILVSKVVVHRTSGFISRIHPTLYAWAVGIEFKCHTLYWVFGNNVSPRHVEFLFEPHEMPNGHPPIVPMLFLISVKYFIYFFIYVNLRIAYLLDYYLDILLTTVRVFGYVPGDLLLLSFVFLVVPEFCIFVFLYLNLLFTSIFFYLGAYIRNIKLFLRTLKPYVTPVIGFLYRLAKVIARIVIRFLVEKWKFRSFVRNEAYFDAHKILNVMVPTFITLRTSVRVLLAAVCASIRVVKFEIVQLVFNYTLLESRSFVKNLPRRWKLLLIK